jgi:bacterioferritin-associated ferredoxin
MIVCICKAVPESRIQEVIEAGARSVVDVGRACGAGTDCGTCAGSIEELITEQRLLNGALSPSAVLGRQPVALGAPCGSCQEPSHEGQRSGH